MSRSTSGGRGQKRAFKDYGTACAKAQSIRQDESLGSGISLVKCSLHLGG